jgi:hypothetical protein
MSDSYFPSKSPDKQGNGFCNLTENIFYPECKFLRDISGYISRHCKESEAMWRSSINKRTSLTKQLTDKVEYYSVWIAALPLVFRDDMRMGVSYFFLFFRGGISHRSSLRKRGIN